MPGNKKSSSPILDIAKLQKIKVFLKELSTNKFGSDKVGNQFILISLVTTLYNVEPFLEMAKTESTESLDVNS